jgi:hypothetical protein
MFWRPVRPVSLRLLEREAKHLRVNRALTLTRYGLANQQ